MAIRAVVFDIGGVLEVTPDPQMREFNVRWEAQFGLQPGELDERMARMEHLWRAGSLGECAEADVERGLREIAGPSQQQVDTYMAAMWQEYVGTLNVELADYFRGLRPPYLTGIISNSFVGAREREEALYRFSELADPIIYSHEVGIAKPDPRIYALTCERMGIQPTEMIFLDDAERCVEGARALGIHGVLFRDNAQAIADINALLRSGGV
ncbi:MAG TPA: HAD family phosphatase [Ktedonobacterales bacterium]|jgi:putative hydrolase of the HAD superfamily